MVKYLHKDNEPTFIMQIKINVFQKLCFCLTAKQLICEIKMKLPPASPPWKYIRLSDGRRKYLYEYTTTAKLFNYIPGKIAGNSII
jgi:hypothetical protein